MDKMKKKNETENPLLEIEMDMWNLIKEIGVLKHEKKESLKQKESEQKNFLLDILETLDAFEILFKNIETKIDVAEKQTKIWVSNFRTIYKLLLRTIKKSGISPIENIIGEKVNPEWHDVVEVATDSKKENETIIEEVRKGYLWKGNLIRACEVIAISNLGNR